ncbi:MAG: CTP synthase (glutamine hydrolyzing) [Candidatus Methanomethylophilus sp.]|nr:CTP synthase (glutamine hydrolyzing) [Methanomethylophilus sp.]MDD3232584.1 CTP synthase (glutamine hydrolyzing) [Methanomethylophilus sp.]MDD4221633.1 CTP synthase (glutamine hydrolyzing) [Methanomethylophilus sp.]MDD4668592.1 CTP synthase (glutamine hydrolyzing) [Methanomethylophilus sp.]
MKLIFVSGGVISGLGKGITASSIGCLLKARGLSVSSVKIDPYLNIDAGTMNPFEHGEVYVLDDGGEVDLDLGNYERFMDLHLGRDNNITTGKVYKSVIENERRGEYLGKTVQIIPHITNEIKRRVTSVARKSGADVTIVELGGTVGDMESMPFLEAARQLSRDLGREENVLFVHTTLVPIMGSVGEEKSKPTQHSVHELMGMGIHPDIIVGRCSRELSEAAKAKIAMFCDVDEKAVISCPDARSIYEVPLILERQGVADYIVDRMRLGPMTSRRNMKDWELFLDHVLNPTKEIQIALVGKYTALADAYLSQLEALTHAGATRACHVKVKFIDSDELIHIDPAKLLGDVDGILIPGGFGVRGVEGKIAAAQYAREHQVPYLGVCLGFQVATIEIARHVLNLPKADSTEFEPGTPDPVIFIMPEQAGVTEMGGTMRLGAQAVKLKKDSKAAVLYGATDISERHRHRYEVNPAYIDRFEAAGWHFTGISEDSTKMEVGELKDHPYFVASQFHPEFKSRPNRPSPLHQGLVDAALAYHQARAGKH